MKRLFILLNLCAIFSFSSARAQNADDQFISIHAIILQGDALIESKQPKEALAAYLEAESALAKFQKTFPGWNNAVTAPRTKYLANQIADIKSKLAKPAESKPVEAAPVVTLPSEPAPTSEAVELQNRIRALQNQVSMLQGDKQLLEAKLKESFAAQPATLDPRELAKAQEDVRALQKENELLKTTLTAAQTSTGRPADAKAVEQLKLQLAESNRKLTDATDKAAKLQEAQSAEIAGAQERVKSLQVENSLLKTELSRAQAGSAKPGDTKTVEQLKPQLADSNTKLAEATDRAAKLAAERQSVAAAKPPVQNDAEAARLRAENDAIKRQLMELQTAVANPGTPQDAARQLAQARAEVALLQSDTEILQLEKLALANRAAYLASASTNSAANTPLTADSEARAKQLALDRVQNQQKLDALRIQNPQPAPKSPTTTASAVPKATTTSAPPAESKPVPYTPEQLALLKQPVAVVAQTNAPPKEPSPENKSLLAEARQAFVTRDFEKASANYLKVLESDPDNIFVLGNLAAIEIELNRMDDAEKHIQKAVTLAPNDAYNFSVLGNLKFKQQKFDDALIALNRAAQLDPTNAVVQNYLGVTLGHKGQRAQAETALRKAIQINPKYGDAQNNLAVLYLTQQPPFIELARWHYQKGVALGAPRNPEIEKMLDSKKAGAAAP